MAYNAEAAVEQDYDIRRYQSGDRDDVIALYEQVFGGDGDAWLTWKYEDNPYVDHVTMTVAAKDGEVVAIKPSIAFQLAVGESELLALQPADVTVHPDHRGRGLFSRTTEHLQRVYADREPALFFNFPNEATLSGSLKHGWRTVEEMSTLYRVQHPRAMVNDDAPLAVRAGARAFGLAQGTLQRFKDRSSFGDETVTRSDHVPTQTLTELAQEGNPSGIHAVRDARYLSWRYENPAWSYRTYLTGYDSARAALVVGRQRTDGQDVVGLTDVYPPVVDGRADDVERLIQAVVADYPDADTFVVDGRVLPESVRRRTGFRPDSKPPLSWFASPSTLVTCPATGTDPAEEDWQIEGLTLTDPSNWHLSLSERDTW